jgi:uncharacterized membrane-anchored protein YjiN (DUF445 family)
MSNCLTIEYISNAVLTFFDTYQSIGIITLFILLIYISQVCYNIIVKIDEMNDEYKDNMSDLEHMIVQSKNIVVEEINSIDDVITDNFIDKFKKEIVNDLKTFIDSNLDKALNNTISEIKKSINNDHKINDINQSFSDEAKEIIAKLEEENKKLKKEIKFMKQQNDSNLKVSFEDLQLSDEIKNSDSSGELIKKPRGRPRKEV